MSEPQEDENRKPEDDPEDDPIDDKEAGAAGTPDGSDAEPDLRSILGGGVARRRVSYTEPERREPDEVREEVDPEEGFAPPYVPPVRPGDPVRPPDRAPGSRAPESRQPEEVREQIAPVAPEDEIAPPYVPPVRPGDPVRPPDRAPEGSPERPPPGRFPDEGPPRPDGQGQPGKKPPPVWPGDEKQPWFRRERGLPPIPESERGGEKVLDPEELPTPLAEIPARGRAWGVTVLLPNLVGLIPTLGIVFGTVFLVINLFLFRQGQDIGAVIFKLRVVRDNGDVAGFFQMFVRNAASTISLLVLGAGYWTAFSDPSRRTWHDKWLGTYVVQDSDEYKTRKRSSSSIAYNWFWIIVLLVIALIVMVWLGGTVPVETVPTDGAGTSSQSL